MSHPQPPSAFSLLLAGALSNPKLLRGFGPSAWEVGSDKSKHPVKHRPGGTKEARVCLRNSHPNAYDSTAHLVSNIHCVVG
ncbi:hypothetical protein GGS21DRAFT_489921 [Xylaria nigripes]|nr:hypothetical protein GGS21DRAFT_489921 [Xylaria nigripes]